jgi:hypothetical protein
VTMPDLIQPEQPRREFNNYSGNFLSTHLTARSWPLVTSICLVRQRTTIVAYVSLMTKRLKQRCESVWDNSRLRCGFQRTGKAMEQVYQFWWRICREIIGVSRFEYYIFYVLYQFVTYWQIVPLIIIIEQTAVA